MLQKHILIVLIIGMLQFFSNNAFAQMDDDDDDDDYYDDDYYDDDYYDDDDGDGDFLDSTLAFYEPAELEPDAAYLFGFTVFNSSSPGAEKGDWINQVDLTMPSQDYAVDEESLTAPDPLYSATGDETEIDRWEVMFDPFIATITWQALGRVTTFSYGDIREGDTLSFEFIATTDDEATDGFEWVLYSDEGNMVTGTAYVEGPPDGDDDSDDDVGSNDDDYGAENVGDDYEPEDLPCGCASAS